MRDRVSEHRGLVLHKVVVNLARLHPFADFQRLHGISEAVRLAAAQVAEQRSLILSEPLAEHRQQQQANGVQGVAGGKEFRRLLIPKPARQGLGLAEGAGHLRCSLGNGLALRLR